MTSIVFAYINTNFACLTLIVVRMSFVELGFFICFLYMFEALFLCIVEAGH